MSIYKDCDIRGIYGKELFPENAYEIGRGLAAMAPSDQPFLVGGDVRVSTPALKKELIRGLTDSGARVWDLGMIPTPVLYFALSRNPGACGATVTASHNPPEHNGVKFMIGGKPVTRETIDRLKGIVESKSYPDRKGIAEPADALSRYFSHLLARFHAKKPLSVVVDAGNGAMSGIAPKALRSAGYRVTELFCEADGRFPNRSPNPAEYENLSALCETVLKARADFGVAFDGDGDRAVFVDNRGRAVINEKSLSLFIRHILKDRPTPVVYDQKSSSVIRKAILASGGTPVPERSGHAFIKRRFLEVGAAVAGEVSGHFFFGELGYDDGLFAALSMAEILCGSEKSLAELADEIVCPPITPDIRLFCPYSEQDDWLARVKALANAFPCSVTELDGVRLEMESGWFLIRKSVTAEQVTLRAEAETPEKLREILKTVASVLPASARESLLKNIPE